MIRFIILMAAVLLLASLALGACVNGVCS